jgi:hypothetical protein
MGHRRGVGNLSTALLSRRLKELEAHGRIERIEANATGQVDHGRTKRGIELEPALDALAKWAQCNIEAREALLNTDVSTLMWQMRGLIFTDDLPRRQIVMQFRFADPGSVCPAGPATPEDLAAKVGCAPRSRREWRTAQAASGYVTHEGGRVWLCPERAMVCAEPDSPGASRPLRNQSPSVG